VASGGSEGAGEGFAHAFTVFTATFNRAHTLGRVYASLAAQTCRDFEWLIVDDGSTDHTAEMVEGWQAEMAGLGAAAFPIRYERQANQGKHAAFNRGVALARGRFFLPLDSDDACLPQALERLLWHWEAIPAAERGGFAAVTALCVDEAGRPLGPPLPAPVLDADAISIKRVHKHFSEKWGFTLTAVLRAHPYPEIPGATFMPEDLVWCAIARNWRTRFVDERLRVYHRGDDQLTGGGLRRGQIKGLKLWQAQALDHETAWFWRDPLGLLAAGVNYARFALLEGVGLGAQWRGLTSWGGRALWLLGLLPGAMLAARDRRRGVKD
jgi:glycosyltransferase involved in cell wall biosynthesis